MKSLADTLKSGKSAAYKFVDSRKQTPYILLFQKKDAWVAKRIKQFQGETPRDGGGLDINFEGIVFYQNEALKKKKHIGIIFLGKSIAYYSEKSVSYDDLISGQKITLDFDKSKGVIGLRADAKSSITFHYEKASDRIVMDRGQGRLDVTITFKKYTDSASITNVSSLRDDKLIAEIENKEVHR